MSDFTIYTILLILVLSFWGWELWISKRATRSASFDSSDECSYGDNNCSSYLGDSDVASEGENDFNAREVLGSVRYDEMTERLSDLIKRHNDDDYFTASIEALPLGSDCSRVLHRLLPGDRVFLLRSENCGSIEFKVFSDGRMIGYITAAEAGVIDGIMRHFSVSGIYVWKQNCYGSCSDITDLDIIIFYDDRENESYAGSKLLDDIPFIMRVDGINPFVIIQN